MKKEFLTLTNAKSSRVFEILTTGGVRFLRTTSQKTTTLQIPLQVG